MRKTIFHYWKENGETHSTMSLTTPKSIERSLQNEANFFALPLGSLYRQTAAFYCTWKIKPAQHSAPLENLFLPAICKMEGLKDSRRMWPNGKIYETDWTDGNSVTWKCFQMMVIPKTTLQCVMKISNEGD